MVRDGAELPNRCIHTNQEVPEGGWRKRKQITWTPQWVFVLIILNLLITLILALALRKKAEIIYSLSEEARNRLIRKRVIALGTMLLGIAIAFGAGSYIEGDGVVAGVIIGIVIAITGLLASFLFSPISVKRYDDGLFTLKGCCPEFINSLEP